MIVGRSSAVMWVELCIYILIYVHFNSTLGERVLWTDRLANKYIFDHRSLTQTFNQFIICLLWYRCDCGPVSRCKNETRSHSLTGLSAVSKTMAFLSSIRCTNSWNRLQSRKTLTPCVYSGHMATKSKILWHLHIIYLIIRLIKLIHFMFA